MTPDTGRNADPACFSAYQYHWSNGIFLQSAPPRLQHPNHLANEPNFIAAREVGVEVT